MQNPNPLDTPTKVDLSKEWKHTPSSSYYIDYNLDYQETKLPKGPNHQDEQIMEGVDYQEVSRGNQNLHSY